MKWVVWIPGLIIIMFFLSCEEGEKTETISQAQPQTQITEFPAMSSSALPAHHVRDMNQLGSGKGKSVSLFITIDPQLSELDAHRIFDFYDRYYKDTGILCIYLFCDEKYASFKEIMNPDVSDVEYFRHVPYSFARGEDGRFFHSALNPRTLGQGSACKQNKGNRKTK